MKVYPASQAGTPCRGAVYVDDGHSLNYVRGEFARIEFSCIREQNGSLQVTIGPQQGNFQPWWRDYRIEVYGWTPSQHIADADRSYSLEAVGPAWTVTVPANSSGEVVRLH